VVFTAAPFLLTGHQQASGPPGHQSNSSGPNSALFPVMLLAELLIMTGLFMSGSWLTMQGARLVARTANGPSGLLAARRLADSPKTAFRSIGGLVLALFVGTAIVGVVPAVNSGLRLANGGKLNNVLRVSFTPPSVGYGSTPGRGLPPQPSAEMLRRVRSYPGASALPIYLYGPQNGYPSCEGNYDCAPSIGIVNCHDIGRSFLFIVRCPPHAAAVQEQFGIFLITNNLLFTSLPLSTSPIPAGAEGSLRGLHMGEVLLITKNPSVLEKIRTSMGAYTAAAGSSNVPETFGEVARTRAAVYSEIETIALAVVAVTPGGRGMQSRGIGRRRADGAQAAIHPAARDRCSAARSVPGRPPGIGPAADPDRGGGGSGGAGHGWLHHANARAQTRIAHVARPCLFPDSRLRSGGVARGAAGHVASAQTHHRSRRDAI
jgi:hypothetical protein